MSEYRLVMKGVVKTFPGVKALDHAQLELRPGKVMALMGENGAGKSTLMKCMFGIYKMDEGEIEYEGEKVTIPTPLDALNRGIAMVHQELQPIPARTVAENIWLGRYPTKKLRPHHRGGSPQNVQGHRGAAQEAEAGHQPPCKARLPEHRSDADGGNRQGRFRKLQGADPGRAHFLPDRKRSGDPCSASCAS